MEVDYAYLCRFAEANADGTIDTIGGDFECIEAEGYPVAVPLVIVAKFSGLDVGKDGVPVLLEVIGPTGTPIMEPPVLKLRPTMTMNPKGTTPSNTSRLVLNLGAVPLLSAGKYEFKLSLGQPTLASVTLLLQAAESSK